MGKVSKNARVHLRAGARQSGRDFVKVVKSVKDPKTGKYTYKELVVHKDHVKDFLEDKK